MKKEKDTTPEIFGSFCFPEPNSNLLKPRQKLSYWTSILGTKYVGRQDNVSRIIINVHELMDPLLMVLSHKRSLRKYTMYKNAEILAML
jgi:hypothetical protein